MLEHPCARRRRVHERRALPHAHGRDVEPGASQRLRGLVRERPARGHRAEHRDRARAGKGGDVRGMGMELEADQFVTYVLADAGYDIPAAA